MKGEERIGEGSDGRTDNILHLEGIGKDERLKKEQLYI